MLVICDFDGTVSDRDTLKHLCSTVGGARYDDLGRRLSRGEINLHQEIAAAMSLVDLDEPAAVRVATDGVGFRPGFVGFVRELQARGDRIVLVSAGMRQLIAPMLRRLGLGEGELELRANDAAFSA